MLFKQEHLNGIKSGAITLAYRKWKKLSVNQGSSIKTSVGIVEVVEIAETALSAISDKDAESAGYPNLKALTDILDAIPVGTIYKIKVRYQSADPRLALREITRLNDDELLTLKYKINRLDQFSKQGDWTKAVLRVIKQHPKLSAANLALITNKEKEWLKINIRKLKNLGLTISHEPGYTLSPLGEYYLSTT
jgi:hypothetical protein